MFEKLIDICKENNIRIEFSAATETDVCRIRMSDINHTDIVYVLCIDLYHFYCDFDEQVMDHFIPMMLNEIEMKRKEFRCV